MPPFHFLVVFTRLACCRSICGHYICCCWTAPFVDWIKIYHSERQKTYQWAREAMPPELICHCSCWQHCCCSTRFVSISFFGKCVQLNVSCRSVILLMPVVLYFLICVLYPPVTAYFCRIGFSSRFKYPLNLNWTPLNLNLWFGPKFSEVAELNLKFSSRFTKNLGEPDWTEPQQHYTPLNIRLSDIYTMTIYHQAMELYNDTMASLQWTTGSTN